MANGKYELRFPVATAYTITVTENGGGGFVVTVLPVDTTGYYLTSSTSGNSGLLTTFANAITNHASSAGTYSMTIADDTDSATGLVTLSVSGGGVTAFTIAWGSDTTLRDWIGYASDITTGTSETTDYQPKGIWLPNVHRAEPEGPDPTSADYYGSERAAAVMAEAPAGGASFYHSYGRVGRGIFNFVNLSAVKAVKAHESLTTTKQSAQSFWQNAVDTASMVLRYHPDRSSNTVYSTYRAVWPEFNPKPIQAGWVGSSSLWALSFDAVEFTP